ncbi:patatin-like phospholipase family protein [Micromonospora carbonacea]|uniref:Patatin-like phospholipase family protein n=1 Tax=Micromonospora carbonacea TaxID=47853 RepID=A0A7H8XR86_9ACTN|nr:patatin-like phospholipase family protein [Micromonospora carbonacea]MBB5824549.1 NTE family protein [Micromonospora carbonacea]QLD27264.1 patatin-like phospholipase family protein [Micromonospora carbonacea]
MVSGPVAFVLGGGGVLGAVEVGMLRALFRADVRPDLVLGTSIGAVNGALVAADPTEAVTDRLVRLWASPEASEVYGDSVARQLRRFAARTHLHSPRPLRRLLEAELGEETTFADLRVPFRCCAAHIERAAEHWFDAGPLVPAVLASASVPGLLPPTEIGGQHFIDGGIVNSIPIGAAVEAGAREVFVLQVGRIERELTPPRRPWEIAQVAFEIARRHRFSREMAALPDGVRVHVLPTGGPGPREDSPWAYRDMAAVGRRISRAYTASRRYLATHLDR